MNIIQRAQLFVQSLKQLSQRSRQDWRRCPYCGDTLTCRYGTYTTQPWFLDGRHQVRIQRHRCSGCGKTYSEASALLVRCSWYSREVHRLGIDHWQHVGGSLRRTAEHLRSLLGHQERWQLWRPWDPPPSPQQECRLAASTVHRWLDGAGQQARESVRGQLAGIGVGGQVGVDGLWTRLHDKSQRVMLLLVDCVTGLAYPPLVVRDEDEPFGWGRLFRRARLAGLDWDNLAGLVSDGSQGLLHYVNRRLEWVNQQRCVFHLWRNLGGELARQAEEATQGLSGEIAKRVRWRVRRELVAMAAQVLDATSERQAEQAWQELAQHAWGGGLAKALAGQWEASLVYLKEHNRGLSRVAPEWMWRDFRLRLSRGRNHGSLGRLERAGLVWAVYRNFTPAQRRSERKRRYRHPGLSPLAVAGVPPGGCSYLDALRV